MEENLKQLLLQDISARLPYGVITKNYKNNFDVPAHLLPHVNGIRLLIAEYGLKPYLRPMSSMTEEEKADLEAYSKQELDKYADNVLNHADKDTTRSSHIALIYKDIDWFNAHHFDYRGLIPMGLALEAPEGMYNI